MKFCSSCGNNVAFRVPAGDNRERYICDSCGTIHYQNPRLVVGTVPFYGDRVLLCKRAIEPRYGFWTLPAGFMENQETVAEGSLRETDEEAGLNVELGDVFSIISVPHVGQVHMFYLAEMLDDTMNPGPETLEERLFSEDQIPWDQISFPTVKQTLRWFFEDHRKGDYQLHSSDVGNRWRKGDGG